MTLNEPGNDIIRCAWVPLTDPLYVSYHDNEWGVPVFDDRKLFEIIILEGAQAGLSWATVLKKRESYRRAFDDFDAEKIIGYSQDKVSQLLQDPGIIRNRRKVESTITNAEAFLRIIDEEGSFAKVIWQFVGGSPKINNWNSINEIPASTPESDQLSKYLLSRGFKFVGTTICYAFMQSIGMVNDHTTDCFKRTTST